MYRCHRCHRCLDSIDAIDVIDKPHPHSSPLPHSPPSPPHPHSQIPNTSKPDELLPLGKSYAVEISILTPRSTQHQALHKDMKLFSEQLYPYPFLDCSMVFRIVFYYLYLFFMLFIHY